MNVFQSTITNKELLDNKIPGYMPYVDLLVLNLTLERFNNENTVGVEIGSLHGRSSYTIAKTINKGTLYCIDPWDNFDSYTPELSDNDVTHMMPKKGSLNSLEVFLENTKCENIIPIKGYSPDCVKDWDTPVDFIFLDGLHQNPNDRENIDFWLPKIKQGGLMLGHDYYKNGLVPDVYANVEYLENKLQQSVTIRSFSSIWMFTIN